MIKVSRGNHKLGKDTLILNITSAAACPSRALGMCKIATKCYAVKAERQYPAVRPYREDQTRIWDSMTPVQLAMDLVDMLTRARPAGSIKYLRFSEAGDFRDQVDVDKMSKVAHMLAMYGVRVYGYTARSDLDYTKVHENMVVNGSGFMVHNSFTATKGPAVAAMGLVCPGDCRECHMCKSRNQLAIKVIEH